MRAGEKSAAAVGCAERRVAQGGSSPSGARMRSAISVEFIESRLEGKFQLEINRDKTRVVDLREAGASLDFLGYRFRYDRDRRGRERKYLNVFPSKKAVQREREKLHEMTDRHPCFKPIPVLIGELNRHLRGWINYFSFGYPRRVYCEIDDTFRAVRFSICSAAASGPTGLRRRSLGGSIWCSWGCALSRSSCMPEARVFRRAGRGKSAPPVRRGERGSRSCVASSPTPPALQWLPEPRPAEAVDRLFRGTSLSARPGHYVLSQDKNLLNYGEDAAMAPSRSAIHPVGLDNIALDRLLIGASTPGFDRSEAWGELVPDRSPNPRRFGVGGNWLGDRAARSGQPHPCRGRFCGNTDPS